MFCIEVDDADYSTSNWSDIDPQTSFSENCALSIDDIASKDNVFIYPNPTTHVLNIKSQSPISKIEVYNVLGENILTYSDQGQIDISKFLSGVYLFKCYSEKGQSTKRIIKL